ncbi:hypothetical protein GUITHDRAFT_151901 [Guillardia theta CCMP2712]|uniref:Uncharacterized protein n=1 Tax=Guillardia theta (strain CCMP2712) TaxID=905079 RepID=L1JHL2_GUITC|nr:hypothetical protein GUITHDRAFT_151901 [Guillardia theta CCMP2712]EKX47986.1 hypothetical protein GUITHDRAFT_151901 [Guillardia theta CCMP2712]|eukprot:XP_005834966.1 hypothetical protein GUITHDRAFT_151901 [Guillardia theta CCMP2712]
MKHGRAPAMRLYCRSLVLRPLAAGMRSKRSMLGPPLFNVFEMDSATHSTSIHNSRTAETAKTAMTSSSIPSVHGWDVGSSW